MATPGWYLDPQGEPLQRYWDGTAWTEYTAAVELADNASQLDKAQRKAARSERWTERTTRWHAQAEAAKLKQQLSHFRGLSISDTTITYKNIGGPILGVHASVEHAGDIYRRITATRLVLTGPLALAWRKNRDERELYLVVEGSGFGFTVPVEGKHGLDARQLASRINALASANIPKTEPVHAVIEAQAPSTGEELERLAALHRAGSLTDNEFAAAKAKTLGL